MQRGTPFPLAAVVLALAAGCTYASTPGGIEPTAAATRTFSAARSPTPSASPPMPASPSPTTRPAATAAPPPGFTTKELRPDVAPQSYLDDTCAYLEMRWNPKNSRPGTVVLPIMYHSIRDPSRMVNDNVTVSSDYFQATVDRARALGFETITSAELISFLTENARIPPRSMILIIDDRRPGVVAGNLLPVAEAFDWTVTLGWIIGDTGPDLWSTMEALAEGGRLDVQSHGLKHQYIVEQTPEDEIRQELAGPIPILEQHFGARPVAFVWPGGNFTTRSVEIAREEGYQAGFTAFSRGPLLFNWIPLGEAERAVGDPLMVLPRAWSPSAIVNLEQAARIGDEATRHAAENRAAEAAWYRDTCGGELPAP